MNFQNFSQMRCHHCHFPRGLGGNILEEKHLLERYLLHFVISSFRYWFTGWTLDSYWVHCFSSNMLFKITKRLFECRKGMKTFLRGPQMWISCSLKPALKVPKCEIFDPFFFTSVNPIWVGDLRTGEKKIFVRRLRQIFAILVFLRMLTLR